MATVGALHSSSEGLFRYLKLSFQKRFCLDFFLFSFNFLCYFLKAPPTEQPENPGILPFPPVVAIRRSRTTFLSSGFISVVTDGYSDAMGV